MHYNKPTVISLILTCILLSLSCSKSDSSGNGGGGTTSATITSLMCSGGSFSATATANVLFSASGTVPYTGGNAIAYNAGTSIASTGVTGLIATLQAGTLANGTGSLSYSITGTPTTTGNAIFSISFGGQSCSLSLQVNPASPSVTALTCGSVTFSAMATIGIAYSGSVTVPYSGGNGASYNSGSAINSTGVTGLTAILQAGTLANGNGNLNYAISGVPSTAGTATFPISFGGRNCSVSLLVNVDSNPLAGVYQDWGVRYNLISTTSWSGPPAGLTLATAPGIPCINPPAPGSCGAPSNTFIYNVTFSPVNSQTITGDFGNVPDPSTSAQAAYYITGNTGFSLISYDFASTVVAGYSNIEKYIRGYIPPSPTQKPAFRLITKYNNATGGSGHDRIIDESFTHQ